MPFAFLQARDWWFLLPQWEGMESVAAVWMLVVKTKITADDFVLSWQWKWAVACSAVDCHGVQTELYTIVAYDTILECARTEAVTVIVKTEEFSYESLAYFMTHS